MVKKAQNVHEVELKSIICRIPSNFPTDVLDSLKSKKMNIDNFSAEVLRLLILAIRVEEDPMWVSFPLPDKVPDDVLEWVKNEENKKMLGRFIYAALSGTGIELTKLNVGKEESSNTEESNAAMEAMISVANSFLVDDE